MILFQQILCKFVSFVHNTKEYSNIKVNNILIYVRIFQLPYPYLGDCCRNYLERKKSNFSKMTHDT